MLMACCVIQGLAFMKASGVARACRAVGWPRHGRRLLLAELSRDQLPGQALKIGGVRLKQDKASTSRASFAMQGISFALENFRKHPPKTEGVPEHSMPVVMGGRYYNPWNPDVASKGLLDVVELMRDRASWPVINDAELQRLRSMLVTDVGADLRAVEEHDLQMKIDPYNGIRVTWISHSTILVQMAGFTFLTDPIWSDRCSPVQFAGPKRNFPVPHSLESLPPVDFVLISHNHYDHLDLGTIKRLGPRPTYYVPLGVKKWFDDLGFPNVVEMNWWEGGTMTKGQGDDRRHLQLVCTPAQHWSSRVPWDRMKSLWCSWAVMTQDQLQDGGEHPRQRFYFGGDSGYCPAFKEIGNELGPFDVAAIPIGAYAPRWFMHPQHIDPQQAVDVHVDVQAKQSFAIHWGAFPLAGDAWDEPPRELYETLRERNMPSSSFFCMRPGESWLAGSPRKPFLENLLEDSSSSRPQPAA